MRQFGHLASGDGVKINSIRHNKTWDLVKLPKKQRALRCKRVYRFKETLDSVSPKYKARIVATVSDNNMVSISTRVFDEW